MKRRSFLAALFAAPMVPVVAKAIEAVPPTDVPTSEAVDGAGSLPLVFEDGTLKLQSANLNQVTAGIIRTRDGKTVIDLGSGCITFKG